VETRHDTTETGLGSVRHEQRWSPGGEQVTGAVDWRSEVSLLMDDQRIIMFGFHARHQLQTLITLAAKVHICSSRIQNQSSHKDLFC